MAKGRAVRPRAADEAFGQRLARRYLRADFRGGENAVPHPAGGLAARHSLNSYLESSRTSRWFERWFWSFVLLCCLVALFFTGLAFFIDQAPTGGAAVVLVAFGLLILVFAVRLQAGVRCMFRHRHDKRKSRR
ncbi:hypothetical protein [Glycomyces arizonensis]|uniref:hypothetical protein n=1 Tax=Glycomyces arizonensis TaxID=256035 RepID=UPI0004168B6A|nr:hypothetical protein [Glycomyces arizonensis]